MHILQSHFEFILINLKGLWAIRFHFPRLMVFPFSSKSICLSLLLQTSHTSSPCHSLLITYFLRQGTKRSPWKRACTTTCPAASNLPSLRCPLSQSPSQASRRAPPFLHQGPHPPAEAGCFILSPVPSVFLSLLDFSILKTGPWNPGCIQLLPSFSAPFYSSLPCGQQKSCPPGPSLVSFFPVLFETVRFQETSPTTAIRPVPPGCKTQWPILSPHFLCLSASFNWPFLSFSLKHFSWLSRTLWACVAFLLPHRSSLLGLLCWLLLISLTS